VPLRQLTAGRKALKIAHGGATYLLQITKANKLILAKPKIDANV
jgi:hemin uptake protein HemP